MWLWHAYSLGRFVPSLNRSVLCQRTLCFDQRRYHSQESNHDRYKRIKAEIELQMEVPEHFNFAEDIIEKWAKQRPDKVALHFTDGSTESFASYSKLYKEAVLLATGLTNPTPPKCALVILPKIFEWWAVNVAGSWCGMIISPATTLLTANDVAHRIAECGVDCVICDFDTASRLNDVTKGIPLRIIVSKSDGQVLSDWTNYDDLIKRAKSIDVEPCHKTKRDDVAQIFFTSGTTGKPKMVPHTQGSYGIGHVAAAKFWLDLREDELIWNISDTGWAKAAWSSLYIPFLSGATVFVHQMPSFNAEEVLRSLCKHPVNALCAPPTAYRAMVQCDLEKYKFNSLRRCVSAGEPLNPEVIEKWTLSTGLQIFEGYGQSETTLLCGTGEGVEIRPGSMGKPAPGYNLKIIDSNWQELGPNEEGFLAVSLSEGHPIGLFKGYMANEKQTSEVFVGDYYLTGDRAYYDTDGYFWFVGRADDVIISSGYRIGPFEVESALLEHPAVAESAAVSSPDSLRGEVVKAFVVLAKEYRNHNLDLLIKELQDHVKKTTAPYKYPRKVEFVESLPKNISGKIRRVVLRNKEWGKS
ncbi:acyl-coenzyme A synthetase ACSM3, mitochondrial-like isoform X2 [Macrobrachium rosenbergii]|uniref:acyl-coenzyme A synthetase ACSM3, mitochondrial-like isoform X2 n=1 Tax=Macrobrachium rosenbergii TaxID=79674 RepID=UPI0034D3F99C